MFYIFNLSIFYNCFANYSYPMSSSKSYESFFYIINKRMD